MKFPYIKLSKCISTLSYLRNFVLWTCPVCGTFQYGRKTPVCASGMLEAPLYRDVDVHCNAIVRALHSVIDAKAGGALFHYNRFDKFHVLIPLIKYYHEYELAGILGEWLCTKLKISEWEEHIDVIVPVPMNKRRAKVYGYNQVELIARGISKHLGCPVESWLVRQDELSSQTKVNVNERTERVMALQAHIPEEDKGKTVLLVDDVMTTGSTLRQCANAIVQADPSVTLCVCVVASVLPVIDSPDYKPNVTTDGGESSEMAFHYVESFDE